MTRRTSGSDLTPRELEVLRLLASGARQAEVAREIGLSVRTVEVHVLSIHRKFSSRRGISPYAVAVMAERSGLLAGVVPL